MLLLPMTAVSESDDTAAAKLVYDLTAAILQRLPDPGDTDYIAGMILAGLKP